MEPNAREEIRPSSGQRWGDFRRRQAPVIVWASAALVVAVMLLGRAQRYEYIGLAQSLDYEISPAVDGTVETILVDLYQSVDAGDLVAKLDDRQVLAEIAAARAEVRRLQAELEAERARMLLGRSQGIGGWVSDLRRFQMDEEQRRLDLLALRVVIESDEIELERLELEATRAERLLGVGLLSQTDRDIARLARDQVRERLETNRTLARGTESELQNARERREDYESKLAGGQRVEPLLAPLREAIEVAARTLEQIETEREALILRSPVAGQVTQILCRTGQGVLAGEPVAMVSESAAREIVAYLDERGVDELTAGSPVLVSSREGAGPVAESVVLRVGNSVQPLPQRLWRDPRVPDYGRAIVIAAAPGMRLAPGEMVNVKVLEGR